MSVLGDAAAAYAAGGWPVGPLHTPIINAVCDCTPEEIERTPKSHPPGRPDGTHGGCSCARRRGGVCRHDQAGKHPRTPNGVDDFSADEATVAAWWQKWPNANIGGRLDTFDVLDVDQPGRMPDEVRLAMPTKVPSSTTGRGAHYFFDKTDPLLAPPTNLSFGEFKAKGYVLLPPSLHPSGVVYTWRHSPDEMTPPAMPKGLAKALTKARRTSSTSNDQRDPGELLTIALSALEALGITPTEDSRGGWRATCPVHGLDGEAHAGDSLALRVGHSALLAYCFAGCDFGAIARKLGVSISRDEETAHLHWMSSQPPVDMGELLEAVIELIGRFWIAEPAAYVAVALWVAHCYVYDDGDTTPRLWIRSATKRSGKTRLYEVMGPLLPQAPDVMVTPTAPLLFRTAGEGVPFLLDEVDQWLDTSTDTGDAVSAVLNAGYKRGATVRRMEKLGDTFVPVDFPVFTPVAYSGIGSIRDTTADRSIPIEMKRRGRHDRTIERFRSRRYAPDAAAVAERLELWRFQRRADFVDLIDGDELAEVGELNDRQEEIWVSLLAVAELAGGDWPARARAAARVLHGGDDWDGADPSHVVLLEHVRQVFVEAAIGGQMPDAIPTADMRKALLANDEWPWSSGGHGGRSITFERIASHLRRFQIRTERIAGGHSGIKVTSWVRRTFEDAWSRYLPDLPPEAMFARDAREAPKPGHPGHPSHPGPDQDLSTPLVDDTMAGMAGMAGFSGSNGVARKHAAPNGDQPVVDFGPPPMTEEAL